MISREDATVLYEQAEEDGTLLENFPLDRLYGFAHRATPGFENNIIKAWTYDLKPWQNHGDAREEYQLEHGYAALAAGDTPDEATLIFRPRGENTTCHTITLPLRALEVMLHQQYDMLERRMGDGYLGRGGIVKQMLAATERSVTVLENFKTSLPHIEPRRVLKLFTTDAKQQLIAGSSEYLSKDGHKASNSDRTEAQHMHMGEGPLRGSLPPPSWN